MSYLLQATQPAPSQLASDIVYVLTGLASFVGVVLAAMALYRSGTANTKATKADAKADMNSQRITNTAAHVAQVDGRQTDLAEKVGAANAVTAAAAAARLAQVVDDRPKP